MNMMIVNKMLPLCHLPQESLKGRGPSQHCVSLLVCPCLLTDELALIRAL